MKDASHVTPIVPPTHLSVERVPRSSVVRPLRAPAERPLVVRHRDRRTIGSGLPMVRRDVRSWIADRDVPGVAPSHARCRLRSDWRSAEQASVGGGREPRLLHSGRAGVGTAAARPQVQQRPGDCRVSSNPGVKGRLSFRFWSGIVASFVGSGIGG
jgi:hypothetical protein